MAELNIFHYLPRQTFLHQLDARVKLLCMLMLCITTGFADRVLVLSSLTCFILMLLIAVGISVLNLLSEVRLFLLFIFVIVIVHAWRVPGDPLFFFPGGRITYQGVVSGAFYGWRIVLLLFLSALLISTTTLFSLRNAIERLFRVFPFIPAAKLGTMFSLVLLFIPLLLDKAAEISVAQKARCVEKRKNPIKRLLYLAYPFLSHTFSYADQVVTAMEARCYTGKKTAPAFAINRRDWLCLVLTVLFCFFLIVMG